MPHLVVVGGGITGLTAAFRASRDPALSVTLLEGSDRLGGKIETVPLGDGHIELSADSFLPRDDTPLRLCRDIGIADELIEPVDFGGWLYRAGRLQRLPAGTVLGFPSSARALLRAGVLSPGARLRAAGDLFNRRPLAGPDVSVASFTRDRFGPQVLDRLVDPLLAGTRAGIPAEMSLAAAIPPVDRAAREHRSVIRGLGRQRREASGRPRFLAPEGGMRRVVEALQDSLHEVQIHRGARVVSVHRDGDRLAIELNHRTIPADAVIVTAPAHEAANLLTPVSAPAAADLGAMRAASSAVVNLLFAAGDLKLPPSGSGVLVPGSERTTISGCTWFSKKWPTAAASEDTITIRCFVGRGMRDPALELPDRDLTGVVVQELGSMLGTRAEPEASRVTRWEGAMPVYDVGHLARVDRIQAALRPVRVAVAGAGYRGSGIPDCIAQAEAAVADLVETLRG